MNVLPDASRTKTLVVCAHPDDETIGLGSVLQELGNATFLWVTDGSPSDLRDAHAAGCSSQEHYASERIFETECAFARAGIPRARRIWLGFTAHEVSLALPTLISRLHELIEEGGFECVITHAREDAHPDHDATSAAVHDACRNLRRPVRIIEMTNGDFSDPEGEIETRHLTPEQREQKNRLLACYRSQSKVHQGIGTDVEKFRVATLI